MTVTLYCIISSHLSPLSKSFANQILDADKNLSQKCKLKLTRIAWRRRDWANNCILFCVLANGETITSLIENRRSLRWINNADKHFSVLSRSQATTIDRWNIESMIRLIATREHVWSCDENFAGYTVDSKNSGIISSDNSIGDSAKATRIGITCDNDNHWCWRRRWLSKRDIIFAWVKNRSIVIEVRQLDFNNRCCAQTTCA